MTVSGVSYNIYIIAAPRVAKASEAAEHIKDYCKENPVKCRVVANAIKGIGNTCDKVDSESCRDKIKEFCEKNPTDRRCVFAFREYCAKHIDDQRCVKEIKLFCSKNPSNEKCTTFCSKYPNVCVANQPTQIEPGVTVQNVGNETVEETSTETGTTISSG